MKFYWPTGTNIFPCAAYLRSSFTFTTIARCCYHAYNLIWLNLLASKDISLTTSSTTSDILIFCLWLTISTLLAHLNMKTTWDIVTGHWRLVDNRSFKHTILKTDKSHEWWDQAPDNLLIHFRDCIFVLAKDEIQRTVIIVVFMIVSVKQLCSKENTFCDRFGSICLKLKFSKTKLIFSTTWS